MTTQPITQSVNGGEDRPPAPGLTATGGYDGETRTRLLEEFTQIASRYPAGHERSALIPMLHLVQSVDGYVSPAGIALCAHFLGLTRSQVSAVATFYSQFRRHPAGEYHVGVCTNALCAVMGGDRVWEAVSRHTGLGSDETSEDGRISLERIECNAACDYAPVVMVNWEFFDNQTPASAVELVSRLERGEEVAPTRGPQTLPTFRENSRLLAGFDDGRACEGAPADGPSTRGLRIAREQGWTAPKEQSK